jgi:hypothetical protein
VHVKSQSLMLAICSNSPFIPHGLTILLSSFVGFQVVRKILFIFPVIYQVCSMATSMCMLALNFLIDIDKIMLFPTS